MMKIIHFIDSSGMYGAEIMLLNLMEEQKRIGIVPILLSIGRYDEKDKKIELECKKKGLKVIKTRFKNNFNIIHNLKLLLDIISNENADILHSHGYKGNVLIGLIPKRKLKFPVICTIHGWAATKRYSKLWLYETMDRYFIQRFDAIVMVANDLLPISGKSLTAIHKKNKIYTIENGIPKLAFTDSIFEDDLILNKEDEFIIGAIGRLSPEKGFEYLIDAMVYLNKECKNFRLILIGDGPEKQKLMEKAMKYGLIDKVTFAGYRDKAYLYLKYFDLFIMPSLTEGLPIVLIEAMQAELPVIATNVGGIPKVLNDGKTGILVAPKDTIAIAKRILFIKRNPNVGVDLGKNARKVALQKYSSIRMANEYRQLYFNLLNIRCR